MKKLFFFIPVILLIIATTFTKNSTKQLDKKIFETKENLRVLQDRYELVMLEYNYLTTPKKLMEYQKQYFDNDLQEADIESFNWIEYENEEIKVKKVVNNNEWSR